MKNKKVFIILIIIFIVILTDQIVKFLVSKNFSGELIGNNIFAIEVTENTGLAFGFNDGNTKNIGLTIFALLIIGGFIVKQFELIDVKTSVALSLVLGGGISNLIDRFIRGGVLDFIKINKFPNFNIADSCIVVGWILIIIFLAIFTKKEKVGECFEKHK